MSQKSKTYFTICLAWCNHNNVVIGKYAQIRENCIINKKVNRVIFYVTIGFANKLIINLLTRYEGNR